jgi:hypothetical protein
MQGARIVGSNDNMTNGFVDLATISQTPVAGQWTEFSFANTTAYRWVKYYGPPGSHGAVAELEFYAGSQRLVGKGFGTSGSRDNSGNTFDRAFDGDTTSFFEGPQVSDQYVGLDLASDNVVATPISFTCLGKLQLTPEHHHLVGHGARQYSLHDRGKHAFELVDGIRRPGGGRKRNDRHQGDRQRQLHAG